MVNKALNAPCEYLQLVYDRKRTILELGQAMKSANFDKGPYEKGCRLRRDGELESQS
jgi:hypothetical protein